MAGSFASVMYWAVHTTHCSALRSEAEQLPFQAVMQRVWMLSGAAAEMFEDHAKSPEGYRFGRALFTTVLVFLDHHSLLVM